MGVSTSTSYWIIDQPNLKFHNVECDLKWQTIWKWNRWHASQNDPVSNMVFYSLVVMPILSPFDSQVKYIKFFSFIVDWFSYYLSQVWIWTLKLHLISLEQASIYSIKRSPVPLCTRSYVCMPFFVIAPQYKSRACSCFPFDDNVFFFKFHELPKDSWVFAYGFLHSLVLEFMIELFVYILLTLFLSPIFFPV